MWSARSSPPPRRAAGVGSAGRRGPVPAVLWVTIGPLRSGTENYCTPFDLRIRCAEPFGGCRTRGTCTKIVCAGVGRPTDRRARSVLGRQSS